MKAPHRRAGALLLLAPAATLHAAEPAIDATAGHRLAPVVITSVAPASPLTLETDPGEPRQPVPASDAADYLKTIPGFSAVRSGGTNGDPVLRGQFGSRLNLLVDGGEMIGACPNRMDAPSSYIAPETYDRLTVIKGPQSVQWGPTGSAGTVLFEREPLYFDAAHRELNAAFLAGSHGRRDQVLDATLGARPGYLRFSGNHGEADDYRDGNGDRVPSSWEKWNADVSAGWTPTPDALIELRAGRGDGEARYAGRGMDGSQFDRESLGLRWRFGALGEVLERIEGQVYYNYADHVMDNYSLRTPSGTGMMAGPMAANVDRRTLGARLKGTWLWQGTELVAGVDAQTSTHRERSAMGVDAYHAEPWTKDAEFQRHGAFAELTRHLNGPARLIAGARLDHHTVEDHRATLGGGMGMPMANPTAGDERRDTLPSGFLRYERDLPARGATLYAGLGHAQRFPDYWELFSPDAGPAASANAFDGVEPEKTTQLDLGAQYRSDALDAWVSAYVGRIEDYILFRYQDGMMGATSQADNVDARIMGGELGATWRFADHWSADASLAYARGDNRDDGEPLPQIPPLESRLGLNYQRGDWSAAALARLVDGQHRVDAGNGTVVGRDLGDSGGFATLALNGAWRVNRSLRLSAGVDNLFDRAYAEHLNLAGNAGFGFPGDERINEPGRTVWARADLTF